MRRCGLERIQTFCEGGKAFSAEGFRHLGIVPMIFTRVSTPRIPNSSSTMVARFSRPWEFESHICKAGIRVPQDVRGFFKAPEFESHDICKVFEVLESSPQMCLICILPFCSLYGGITMDVLRKILLCLWQVLKEGFHPACWLLRSFLSLIRVLVRWFRRCLTSSFRVPQERPTVLRMQSRGKKEDRSTKKRAPVQGALSSMA